MSANAARKRATYARAYARMLHQAGRSGALALELFPPLAAVQLFGAAIAGDADALARVKLIGEVLRHPPADCAACGQPLGHPAVLGLLRSAREPPPGRPQTAFAFACCSACAAEGGPAMHRKLAAWLGGRAIEPTHAESGGIQ